MTAFYICGRCEKKFKTLKAFNDHECEDEEKKEEQVMEMKA